MMNIYTFILFILFTTKFNDCRGGIFSWLFKNGREKVTTSEHSQMNLGQTDNHKPNLLKYADDDALSVKIPFELKTSDEKFLNEVSEYTSKRLSQLDICHHRVILNLQNSCADLTEEELAKVAVSLLNCQSAIENRAVYPCTESMALAECTSNMDSDTWNAYHIVSNRVRAVCYHFRQQQFTAKTEMTVNKLMISTEEQIYAMQLLEKSQDTLKKATSETLNSLNTGHEVLQKQQKDLSSAQTNIRNYVSSNIRDLTREKRLIASGQKELAEITLTIKRKLEEAQKQLNVQGSGQRDTHKKILQDLSEIQDGASKVWSQIDESTKMILLKHEQTVTHYSRLMEDLQKMNSTVHHLMDILVKMKYKVEEKFSWISSLVGDTDATVQKIYSFVLHICYCLLGMVAASFLQVPYATRMALIILVPLNALSEMKHETSLYFSTLTLVLGICMFFNLSTIGAVKIYRWRKCKNEKSISYTFASQVKESCQSFSKESSSEIKNSYSFRTPILNETLDEYSSEEKSTPNKNTRYATVNLSTSYASPLSSILEEEKSDIDAPSTKSFPSGLKSTYQAPLFSLTDSVRRRILSRDEESPRSSTSLHEPLHSFSSPHRTPDRGDKKSSRNSPSQSTTPKKLCTAICKSGMLCKNVAGAGEDVCFRHLNGFSRESTPLR